MKPANWLAAAGLAVLAQGCASPSLDKTPMPAPPTIVKGDRWTYVEKNGYNQRQVGKLNYEVTDVKDDRIVLSVATTGALLSASATSPQEIYHCPWNVEVDAVYDRTNRYSPPSPLVPWDLAPGESRRDDSEVLRPEDRARDRWQVRNQVAGWERIRVPAGEFDTVRIERHIFFDHPSIWRTSSVRRDILWYAPQAKRWVRREWNGSYHLRGSEWMDRNREDWVVWELAEYSVTPAKAAASAGATGTHCGTP